MVGGAKVWKDSRCSSSEGERQHSENRSCLQITCTHHRICEGTSSAANIYSWRFTYNLQNIFLCYFLEYKGEIPYGLHHLPDEISPYPERFVYSLRDTVNYYSTW